VIDEAAAGGGEARLDPGVYMLEDALRLRSGVRLVGREGVVLTRAPSVESALRIYCGYGLYEFAVREPDRFRVGQGIHLTDDHSFGFYDTVATIVGRDGDRFYLDRPLRHDYVPTNNGRAATLFPLLAAEGRGAGGRVGLGSGREPGGSPNLERLQGRSS
jgi:hypothetical protein